MPSSTDGRKVVAAAVIRGGVASFVYSDAMAGLVRQHGGRPERASHVEPHPTLAGWIADMRPSDGPVLGMAQPFELREEALQAERAWLYTTYGIY